MSEPDASTAEEAVAGNLFPNNNRRRIPGVSYVIIGVACVVLWLAGMGDDPVLVNAGLLLAGVLLILAGAYSIVTGWNLAVDEEAALQAAAVAVGRPIGHASAQMGWRGWLSRPTWRILWYSAEDPPLHRGMVVVDGHDGTVLEHLVQDNPEDWQHLDGSLDTPR